MGKRLPRSLLLEEIATEWGALNELLKQIKPREMTPRGVTPGGWSVKDILAHILGWQEHLLRWHQTELRGGTPAVPAPGMTWRDLKRFNQMIYEQHRLRPLRDVLRDFTAYHRRMMRLIDQTADGDLVAVGRYRWMGPTWCLSDYCRAETASHYHWARKWIRPWLRAQGRSASSSRKE